MLDRPLRLFKDPLSPSARQPLPERVYQPQLRPTHPPRSFPRSNSTLYINAVPPTKTRQAYAQQQPRHIRPDTEQHVDLCVCGKLFADRLMVKCEGYCRNWYHPLCLGMENREARKLLKARGRWYCPACRSTARSLLALVPIDKL